MKAAELTPLFFLAPTDTCGARLSLKKLQAFVREWLDDRTHLSGIPTAPVNWHR